MKNIFFVVILFLIIQISGLAQFEKWRPTVSDPKYYYQLDNKDSLLATMFINAGGLPNIISTDSILSGKTTSNIIDTKNRKIGAIIFPGTFTGSSVSILTSDDTTSASFKALEYDGSLLTITATANRQCAPSPVRVASTLRYIKWVSSSSEGAKRIIKTVLITF